MYDYIVIGSGIAGNVFAYEAGKLNKTCVILEKTPYRIDKTCGGGIPRKAIDLLKKIHIDISSIPSNKYSIINGVRCKYKDSIKFKPYDSDSYAIGIRRCVFDEFLLQNAIKEGAHIAYGEYVTKVDKVDDGYIVNGYCGKNVVYACGARGLKEQYTLGQSIAISTIIQGDCTLANDVFHYFYLDDTKERYVWAFPVGKMLWNIGLWSRKPYHKIKEEFNLFFESNIKQCFRNGYKVIADAKGEFLGNVNQSAIYNARYGIGDFAGLNNIKNGGGITQAIESAIELSHVLNTRMSCEKS